MDRIINIALIIGVLLLAFMLLINGKTMDGYQKINPTSAKTKLEQEENVVLLDVRTQQEYQIKHIPESILIPLDSLEKEVGKKIPEKDQTIIIYCRSGNRSKTAANILLKKGYKNVYDLGGINTWPFDTQ